MFRTRIAVCALLGLLLPLGPGLAVASQASAWSLIPRPAIVRPAAGGAVTVADEDVVTVNAQQGSAALDIVARFAARVADTRGIKLRVRPDASHARIVFDLDADADIKNDAGYRIDIGADRIDVKARTARGLFYGAVTTWQLLTPDARHGAVHVADGKIIDHPRFQWRGYMLDSSRHFQSVDEIKKLIDWMALHKLNMFHWHLTDDQGWRLEIKRYPKLTSESSCRKPVGPDAAYSGGPDQPYCGFYTQDEVREVVRYAAKRFVTVVPEIEVPGHAQAALHAYPELGVTGKRPPVSTDWGVNTWLYAPDQKSLTFLENVLDEVMKLFPSKYIHIGGDEAAKDQWKASPKVHARLEELGLDNVEQLQGWMVDQIGAYLKKHGRILVGWDEILAGGNLPQSAIVMSWRGVEGAVTAAKRGHDTILSPSPVLYLDHVQSDAHDEPPARPTVESLKDVYTFNPRLDALNAKQVKHIIGVQANLWTEYMPTFARIQFATFPRMAAWSETAWSPANATDWNGFLQRMNAQVARYKELGIDYADSAWAPRFRLSGQDGKIHVALSNQVGQGDIRYTTDGSTPTPKSKRYTHPFELPANDKTVVSAATFSDEGLRFAKPRTREISAASLLTRNSDQLATCKSRYALRLEDDRPLDGPRPVYKVAVGDTCWLWNGVPMDGVQKIALRVGNLPWNYALWKDASKVVARPRINKGGEFEVHLDRCDGPLLARLPLTKAAKTKRQTTLRADLPKTHGKHDLCIFATGDPREGRMWAIDTVRLSPALR